MNSLNLREKEQLASRTLNHLPYFHGIMDEVRASGKLRKGGDFLIFLNKNRNKTVTLALRTINEEVLHLPITAAADGHFRIEGANQNKHYFNIDSLIKFHLENGLFISKTRATYFMKHACLNRLLQKEYTTSRLRGINYLKYYAGCVNDCDLSKWLANDGDYLLRSVEDDKMLELCVFWNNCICVLKNTFRPTTRRFILPRENQQEPWESVNSIDHFLKSLVRGGFLLEGVQLRQAADINKSWSGDVNALNVSRNIVAKLPLHKQPYYHGITSSIDIESRLTRAGQFCVFLEKTVNVLLLAVHCESSTLWYSIKADGVGKVWLRNNLKFGTVEELIDYYLVHGLPGINHTSSAFTKINTAVQNPYHFMNVTVETCNLRNVSYYHGYLGRAKAAAELINDGDFLLRRDSDGRLLLCVRWLNRCRHLHISENSSNGLLKLYGTPGIGPNEFAQSIDEFVKSLVRCQQIVRGLVLQRPVHARRKNRLHFTNVRPL